MYSTQIKPVVDIAAAAILLLVLSPVFIGIAVLFFFNNKGTPFFIQKRPGKDGRIFSIIKFKTMTDEKDASGQLQIDPSLAGFTREDLRLAFLQDNIESRPLWKPMHLQPVFKDCLFLAQGFQTCCSKTDCASRLVLTLRTRKENVS